MVTEMGSMSGIVVGKGVEVWVGLEIGGCDRGGICEVDGMDCEGIGRGLEMGLVSIIVVGRGSKIGVVS